MLGKLLFIGYFFGPAIVGIVVSVVLLILHLWWWALGAVVAGLVINWGWLKLHSAWMNPL